MKKGFTLIELLAVIIILGAISAIVVPTVRSTIDNSRQAALESSIENLKRAAINYSLDNLVDYNTEYRTLSFSELISKGFIEARDIINPVTDENLEGCLIYKWDTSTNQYIFEYDEDCSI